jgi:hypothetical protein
MALAEIKHHACEQQIINILTSENEIEEVRTVAVLYLGALGTQKSTLFKLTSVDR